MNKLNENIEVVTGAIIENDKGQLLLCRSPKWHNKWTMPGGHLDVGETIQQAVLREAKEETNLDLEYVGIVHFGELINSVDFHRPAHFIYFDAYCKVVAGNIRLQEDELTEYKWVLPQEAFDLDLAESYPETIQAFINYKNKNGK